MPYKDPEKRRALYKSWRARNQDHIRAYKLRNAEAINKARRARRKAQKELVGGNMAKPKPVPREVVCSECGLSWADHTKDRKTDPTPDVCIRLLKVALAQTRESLNAARRWQPMVSGTTASALPWQPIQFGKSQ